MIRVRLVPRSEVAGLVGAAPARRARRRSPLTVLVLLATVFAIGGLASAQAEGTGPADSGTEGDYHNINPVKTVASGATVAAGKVFSVAARGGTTTVPTTARAVRLRITIKGRVTGVATVFPLGRPEQASPTTIPFTSATPGYGTVDVQVGVSDKIALSHTAPGSVYVTIQIAAYTDQVTASTISGLGGNPGDVLRTDGYNGAYWGRQAPVVTVREKMVTMTGSDTFYRGYAECNSNEYPVSGGFSIYVGAPDGQLRYSYAYNQFWLVGVKFASTEARTVTVYALCAQK